MSLKQNFQLMAEYNRWINERLYRAASQLDATEIEQDRGAFFGSIIGTLNHILVGDIFWLKRFADHPAKLDSLDYVRHMDKPVALDAILHRDLQALRKERVTMDDVVQGFVEQLDESLLTSSLTYQNTRGESFSKTLAHLIQHFFNHQTHHRGQVTTLLSQAGVDVGVTDLLVCIPNEL